MIARPSGTSTRSTSRSARCGSRASSSACGRTTRSRLRRGERQGVEVAAQRRRRNDRDAACRCLARRVLCGGGRRRLMIARDSLVTAQLDREPSMRHAVGLQRVELGQPELQRVKAEQVGDGTVEMALLPLEQHLPDGGPQPLGQLYDRAFRHEPDRSARVHRQHHLDDRRRRATRSSSIRASRSLSQMHSMPVGLELGGDSSDA